MPATNVTLENNFFAIASDGGFYSVFFNDQPTFEHILVRNNSATQEMYFSYGTPMDAMNDVRVVGKMIYLN